MEPLLGYPEEYTKFVDSLEAPWEGTQEAKRKAQTDLLSQFNLKPGDIAVGGKMDTPKSKKKKRKAGRRFGDHDLPPTKASQEDQEKRMGRPHSPDER